MKSLFTACILGFVMITSAAFANGQGIQWSTNYQESLAKAKTESKPVVLFFTGSDWCGWCKRLEQEAFDKPEFVNAVGDKMVFVFLDYPMRFKLDPQTADQNQKLKEQFQITGYPTVVVLNSNGELLGRTGYLPGGPKAYASHLMSMTR